MAENLLDRKKVERAGLPNLKEISGERLFRMVRSLRSIANKFAREMDSYDKMPHSEYDRYSRETARKNFSAAYELEEWIKDNIKKGLVGDEAVGKFNELEGLANKMWNNDAGMYSFSYADMMQNRRDSRYDKKWMQKKNEFEKFTPFATSKLLNEAADIRNRMSDERYHYEKALELGNWLEAAKRVKEHDRLAKKFYEMQMELEPDIGLEDVGNLLGGNMLINGTWPIEDSKYVDYRQMWPYVR